MTTVLICADSRGLRDGLSRRVAELPGVDRVETAGNEVELLRRWGAERPALVLLAARLADGARATRALLDRHPDANVVLIGGPSDANEAGAAISSGARGVLTGEVTYEEVCATVASALAYAAAPRPRPAGPELTERELQVLRGMAQGRSNAQIGRSLYLSEDTVKTHARRLFRKLEVGDRAQAVARGFRYGLVR